MGDTKQTYRINVNQLIREPKTERLIIQPNDVISVDDTFAR